MAFSPSLFFPDSLRKGQSGCPPKNAFPAGPRISRLTLLQKLAPRLPLPGTQGEGACWGCPLVTRQFLGWKMSSQKWGARESVNLLMLHPQKRKKADWLQSFSKSTQGGEGTCVATAWQALPCPPGGLGFSTATSWLSKTRLSGRHQGPSRLMAALVPLPAGSSTAGLPQREAGGQGWGQRETPGFPGA